METGVRDWGYAMLEGVLAGYVAAAAVVGCSVAVTGQIVV